MRTRGLVLAVVDLNRIYRSDEQPQEWAAAMVQL